MIHYNNVNVKHAKQLRKDMTPWERKLWYCFLKDYPVHFQRQKCIDNYIADFYCFRAKLIIELDGVAIMTRKVKRKMQSEQKDWKNTG